MSSIVFLQKYHHKGAFHQDQEILKKHDYTAPTISTVDVSSLPSVLQKRNFGKMSQSKYTHLADQDTSRKDGGFGGISKTGSKAGGNATGNGCFLCGGPHVRIYLYFFRCFITDLVLVFESLVETRLSSIERSFTSWSFWFKLFSSTFDIS